MRKLKPKQIELSVQGIPVLIGAMFWEASSLARGNALSIRTWPGSVVAKDDAFAVLGNEYYDGQPALAAPL